MSVIGVGVGDIIAVTKLGLQLYRGCEQPPFYW